MQNIQNTIYTKYKLQNTLALYNYVFSNCEILKKIYK